MDLETPWTPTLDGATLEVFERLQLVLDEERRPSSKLEPRWVQASIKNLVANIPEAQKPLWDCVLSLWQLKESAPSEDGHDDDDRWREHVSAWLVSIANSRWGRG